MTDITANQEKQSATDFQTILAAVGKCISAAEKSTTPLIDFNAQELDEFKSFKDTLNKTQPHPNQYLQKHFDNTVDDVGYTFMRNIDFFLYCIWNDPSVDKDSCHRMEHMYGEVISEILLQGYYLKDTLLENLYSSSIIHMAGMHIRVAEKIADRENLYMEENTAPALKKIKKPGRI